MHLLVTLYHEIESWLVSRHRKEIFVCSKASKEALGLTRPPVQCIQVALSPGVQLATHTHYTQLNETAGERNEGAKCHQNLIL